MKSLFRYATRLNSFKARPDLHSWQHGPAHTLDLIKRADFVPGLDTVELNYVEHFASTSVDELRDYFRSSRLKLSGINLRYPDADFSAGAFTNPAQQKREDALRFTYAAIDACIALGGEHVVIWLGQDGFDYPFQLNYAQAWNWTLEAMRKVATYAPDLRISIEYKPMDPRRQSLVSTVGTTLLLLSECDAPNLGVTLDFCHVLMANEHPALAAALCLRKGLLYSLHLNDGYGQLDDGMMVGSIHLPQTLEVLYYALAAGFDGVLYFDTFPYYADPVEECRLNIETCSRLINVIEQLDKSQLEAIWARQDALATQQLLQGALLRL